MNTWREIRVVAAREFRERRRSRVFKASLVVMVLVVVAVIVLPQELGGRHDVRRVGVAGRVGAELPAALAGEARAAKIRVRVVPVSDRADGVRRLRAGDVDALVLDGPRVLWLHATDPTLQSVLFGALQVVAVSDRARAAGIDPGTAARLLAPIGVSTTVVGAKGIPAKAQGDVVVLTIVLFIAISIYGSTVLVGVVEEKSSRVVEVLLARMPASALLAGKIAGIGSLGLAQFALTAVAALVAMRTVGTLHASAISPGVLAWAVLWFVLGYAFFAVLYGVVGSLASRVEDAQAAAAPVTVILVAAYVVALTAAASPDGALARVAALVPVTAPLVSPGRAAFGLAPVWEAPLAIAITLGCIVALVRLGGRIYAGAALRFGRRMPYADALRLSRRPA